ncbi:MULTISPECIES: hypothetical protein [Nocardia]|uniref:hypothetical protein n=1 Tax=Nocardia TaxID=1817 RepID=UPI0007EC1B8C|nr:MULTISPECIES: hypothetical protein [Nocardia]MBF6277477.1 hypothetical protein [Nocardia nova]OBA53483.1 hypothetical protein A5789_23990 [Nocardia sp. 852002-51101_SCH5132738]OBB48002.1 hypothetical protein A5748_21905 [Nocardia sp. 852002-51244_SCH5132740]OBF66751.1 hypothetical protein A9X06_05765 [Mycobacterium sp. 852002-51759_SCH5129042]
MTLEGNVAEPIGNSAIVLPVRNLCRVSHRHPSRETHRAGIPLDRHGTAQELSFRVFAKEFRILEG